MTTHKTDSQSTATTHSTDLETLVKAIDLTDQPRFHYYRAGGIHDWNCKTCELRREMQRLLKKEDA